MATKEGMKEAERSHGQTTSSAIGRREPRDRYETFPSSPFAMMRRMQDELDRWLGDPGGSHAWFPSLTRRPGGREMDWTPAIDVFQRGNELVIRADMPGMTKDDIELNIGDNVLTIRGERHQELEEEREGVFRSERSYGSFCRVVPLPQGTIAEDAKANFTDGVLEIVMPAPSPEVKRGRRIEIGTTPSARKDEGGKRQ